MMGRPIFKTY